MNHFLSTLLALVHLLSFATPVRPGFLSKLHLPRPLTSYHEARRPSNEVLEICWGDKQLTISPRALPTLIEYFRVCTNAVYVLSPEEEPRMLSTLRNKIYNTLPDVNKAFLYSAIPYEQVAALETTLNNVEKVMAEKNIPNTHPWNDTRWLTINLNSSAPRSDPGLSLRDPAPAGSTSDNPCKDLVVLDGVDKASNESLKFIPTPYQDDPVRPHYMAIPFSKHFLYNIHHKDSANVLRNYYRLAVRCLRTFDPRDVARFKENLYGVIVARFLPVIQQDPFRIIPAYGGVMEILADTGAYLKNVSERGEPPLHALTNWTSIHFKKISHGSKSFNTSRMRLPAQDWEWSNSAAADNASYYQSLLLLLAGVCFLNCVCYIITFLFYFVIRRKQPKLTSSTRSSLKSRQGIADSRCSMWSGPRDVEANCCHDNQEKGPFTSCLATDDQCTGNAPVLQHIKCPHNMISPRPRLQGCKQKYFYQVGDFSLFKSGLASGAGMTRPLLTCDRPHAARTDDEGMQSIQGSEEFQRIMRELDEVHRSIQHVFPRTNAKCSNDGAPSTGMHGSVEPASTNQRGQDPTQPAATRHNSS